MVVLVFGPLEECGVELADSPWRIEFEGGFEEAASASQEELFYFSLGRAVAQGGMEYFHAESSGDFFDMVRGKDLAVVAIEFSWNSALSDGGFEAA